MEKKNHSDMDEEQVEFPPHSNAFHAFGTALHWFEGREQSDSVHHSESFVLYLL